MEISTLLAIISPICAVIFGIVAMRRGQKSDDAASGREMGTILSEMGYVKAAIDGLGRKFDAHELRYTGLIERVSAVEQSTKAAHRRIDDLVKGAQDN